MFWKKIGRFFFPSSGTPLWLRIMPYLVLGVLTAIIISGSIWTWDYTNSTSFCGTSCHTMPPEYSTYQRSPHARVECVECHLGRDSFTEQLPRKIGHSRTLISLIFKTYEFPIVATKMRPANESCETCHFPEKFSDDSLREIKNFTDDEQNTSSSTFLVMKTGGGSSRQGLGRGIHWHIENLVEFYTPDTKFQQEIPYIRVTAADGSIQEYIDVDSDITSASIAGEKLDRVDCITCHNRVTHNVPYPDEAVEQAFVKNLIPSDLPFAKKVAVDLLSAEYQDSPSAIEAMQGFADYYSTNYPDIFAQREEEIQKSVDTLKEMYPQMRYPEQELDWTSHPNNIGHQDSPGCFRCHDGKHLAATGEVIRLECNICHSIPTVSDNTQLVTSVEVSRGPEPPSHTNTSWMTLHGKVKDNTCLGCHTPKDSSLDLTTLTGKPPTDGSFCGNSACHGAEWQYTGFGSPALAPFLDEQLASMLAAPAAPAAGAALTYTDTIKPLFDTKCAACHTGDAAMAAFDASTYAGILKGGQSGTGVTPNDLTNSDVYTKQNAGGHFGQFSPDELDILKSWIEAGAPE